jgi:hypothetical protein
METHGPERPLTEAERGFDVIAAAACFAVTAAFTYDGVKMLDSPFSGIREGAVGAGVIALAFAGIGWHKLRGALWPETPQT